jgi:hypothetical protein
MMKMSRKNLADVFGWMNVKARDFADSLGNLSGTLKNIQLVESCTKNIIGMRGAFELAAHAWKSVKLNTSTTGRPYRPTFAFPAPALELR